MWYEELGYDENPFELNPFKIDFKLVNRNSEAEELLYRIEAGSMMLIEGKNGKTALLKHAVDNFKGKGKVIYIDGNKLSKRLNIEELLIKKSGLVKGRLFKKKPKGMILLFDNVQQLQKKQCEKIKYYFDQDYLKSVVFTTNSYKNVNFTPSLKDRIGERVIKLRNLIEEDAIQIVKNRIKDHLDEEIIREIYKNSNKNLKKFLTNCSFILENRVDNKLEEIKKEDIKSILKEKEYKEIEPQTNICPDCKDELEKIGEYWRCKNCDIYCKNCGALVDVKDIECPECGIKFEAEEGKGEVKEKEKKEIKKEAKKEEKKRRKEEEEKEKETEEKERKEEEEKEKETEEKERKEEEEKRKKKEAKKRKKEEKKAKKEEKKRKKKEKIEEDEDEED